MYDPPRSAVLSVVSHDPKVKSVCPHTLVDRRIMPRKAVRVLLKIAMVDPIICCNIGLWFLGVRCKRMEQVGCRNTDRYHRKIRQHLSRPKTLDSRFVSRARFGNDALDRKT